MSVAVDPGHVLIRMYNVGFGDCFMLAFPADDRPRTILIDCGSHNAGRGPKPIAEVAERVVDDSRDGEGSPRIDVVVGTHRHQDHVSGFNNAIWSEVEVGEVWMPWTEDPTDREARRIREKQSRIAHSLCLSLAAAADTETEAALALAENSLTNAKAMKTLHRGFAGQPKRRFLPHQDADANTFSSALLPGVLIHAIGPSRDERVIRDMDPPIGKGYLQLLEGQQSDQEQPPPFRSSWAISPTDFSATEEFEHLHLTEPQMRRIDGLSSVDYFQIAVALEKAVNGTSLMLAFEIGDGLLLFPGDAQWGTWDDALRNERWRELLSRTTFYKIGHHGSHNATPREYIEELLWSRRPEADAFVENFSAAVSTRRMDMWKSIPKEELIAAIEKTTASFARSDARDHPVPGFEVVDEIVTETLVPIHLST